MIIDIFLLLFAFGGFWLGYSKGIVGTLFSLLSYTVALLLTLKISPWLMDFLTRSFKIDKLFALIFGTIGILILMIVLIRWLVRSVENYLKKSKLTTFSKVAGGVITVLVSILVFSLVLWSINQLGMVSEKTKSASISYKTLQVIPGKAGAFIEEFKPLFRRYWELMQETIQESKSGASE